MAQQGQVLELKGPAAGGRRECGVPLPGRRARREALAARWLRVRAGGGRGAIGANVVVVFKVVGRGKTSLVFALTQGDTSSKAVKAVTHRIRSV